MPTSTKFLLLRKLLSELAPVHHRITRRYAIMPFIALELSEAALRAIVSSPLVVGVTEDIRVLLDPTSPR